MTGLPQNWPAEPLGDIAHGGLFVDGDWVETKDQDPIGGVRLTQLADIGVAEFRDRSDRWMRADQAAALNCTYLQPGDLLIARMPEPLGRACLVPTGLGTAVTAVDVAVLRLERPDIDRRFVMWALNSPTAREQMVRLQSGTTRKRISRKNLARVKLPVPPFEEQQRIVEILEDHLSRLDAAATDLELARQRLRLLVASATEALRIEALASGGDAWLGSLAITSGYGTSAKCVPDGPGPAVVRIPNLVGGTINLSDEKRIQDGSLDVSGLILDPGDLLIVRTNGSRDLIGRTGVVQEGVQAAFASYLIRYKLDVGRVRPQWVHLMMQTPGSRRVLESMAASSAGQYNLSLSKLDQVVVPVPELDQQDRLLARWGSIEESVGRLREELGGLEVRRKALHRSLLTAAFAGRLMGRTGDDEVVEELAGV